MSTTTTQSPLTPANPAPAVASHGSYSGECIGATVVLNADIVMQQLCNDLEVTYAKMATHLAEVETEIQNQLSTLQGALWTKYGMDAIQAAIQAGKTLSGAQTSAMNLYSSQLGADQAAIQAGTKSIDPTLTPTQNMPQALTTSANEEMTEAGSVIQGISFLANCKIS